ncbi:LysE family translocator [Pectobacterium aroidearum]|uniref:LysE family translocator n=1 Tax=Pectobacterium aroidearum TaxID=1201031 RepID=A0AAW3SR76_9GAMM|nr:LysE family translocator [Pectobacterium aroidearum]MBA5202560.1 LysE family translocator [Pectobacterium aroidearum]
MEMHVLLLFAATVLPLVCTPGPDLIYIASQAVSGGTSAGLRSTTGVIIGYCVHSLLVALGLAAIVMASPVLFEAIRWTGIGYLVYLAYKLIRAALRPGGIAISEQQVKGQLYKGFLTSLLNPKGMMIYIAILPQFMNQQSDNITYQAFILSAIFMFLCAVIYSIASVILGHMGNGKLSDLRRRQIDGVAGGMILIAASFIALAN